MDDGEFDFTRWDEGRLLEIERLESRDRRLRAGLGGVGVLVGIAGGVLAGSWDLAEGDRFWHQPWASLAFASILFGLLAVSFLVWLLGLTQSRLRALHVQGQLSEFSVLLDERDVVALESHGHAASSGSGELTVEATDRVGVTDEVTFALRREANRKTTETLGKVVETASNRSWIERWGGLLSALTGAAAVVLVGFLAFAKSSPPDCSAYVGVLLDVNAAAVDGEAALAAVELMSWDKLDELCGPPSEFLKSLNG